MLNYLSTILSQFIIRLESMRFRKSKASENFQLSAIRGYKTLAIAAILMMSWDQVNSFAYSAKQVGGKDSISGSVAIIKTNPTTSQRKFVDYSTKQDTSEKTVNKRVTQTDHNFFTNSVDTNPAEQVVLEAIQASGTDQSSTIVAEPQSSSTESPILFVSDDLAGIDVKSITIRIG